MSLLSTAISPITLIITLYELALPRTKLTNVASENMFKDLIAGHARELVNNQEKCL